MKIKLQTKPVDAASGIGFDNILLAIAAGGICGGFLLLWLFG